MFDKFISKHSSLSSTNTLLFFFKLIYKFVFVSGLIFFIVSKAALNTCNFLQGWFSLFNRVGFDSSHFCFPSEKKACSGLGLIYTILASGFFSVAALLVKKIDGIHAVEISAIRCFFQMLFVMPAMIYYK